MIKYRCEECAQVLFEAPKDGPVNIKILCKNKVRNKETGKRVICKHYNVFLDGKHVKDVSNG